MEIIKYCKALADETRARLVNVLLEYELNVGEIVQVMEMGQSRISRHLKILADSGLVNFRREGLWAFYRVSDDGPGRDFLDGITKLLEDEEELKRDRNRADKVIRERTAATRQFFDDIAPEWDRMTAEVLGDLDLGEEIRKRLPQCECAADIGCGPGDMLEILARSSNMVIGVDNSPKMLELAEERFSEDANMSLRIGETTHLPLRDLEADCTVMSLVLHHLARPIDAIREAGRVLRTGGRLLVAEFDQHDNEIMRSEYGDRRLGIPQEKMHNWLGQTGFAVLATKEFKVNKGLVVVMYEAEKL
ncbi:Transcriptional regulator, ArsR family [Pseudodesulfovibrio profundus]|uniref:Transcriptional regulator, ArsR family n=1 Tax=Pseudodesulfovibrio profundus TaxID=57320 RepID=A0A2C8FBJ1_9BACT|nr:metalloregulator ArsR/SmtB family transcription factor [Pseudodesulfovibrio profundus]MBC15474.1 ArsR family transcriptional regulator [Desulfovibrio sp.]SOB60006.1 Transcriptional regulator, ArsR family [Pseudodesulfovibrio profundus]|tara:strand:+ start:23878 stop:24789 length:912 start_codon:yes stop_codon:yes gene_type:complete